MVYIIIVLLLLLGIKKSMLSRPWSCSKVHFNFATRPLFATQASVAEISTVTETAAPAGKSPCNLAAIASGEKPPQKVKETRVSSVFFFVGANRSSVGSIGVEEAQGLLSGRASLESDTELFFEVVPAIGLADTEHTTERRGSDLKLREDMLDIVLLQAPRQSSEPVPGKSLVGLESMYWAVHTFPFLSC